MQTKNFRVGKREVATLADAARIAARSSKQVAIYERITGIQWRLVGYLLEKQGANPSR